MFGTKMHQYAPSSHFWDTISVIAFRFMIDHTGREYAVMLLWFRSPGGSYVLCHFSPRETFEIMEFQSEAIIGKFQWFDFWT